MMKQLLIVTLTLLLIGCTPGNTTIGPRTEEGWKNWEAQQEELKKTWGDTPVYAYIQKLMDDLLAVNARVVFSEDFSFEEESEELNALKQLYQDMQIDETVSLNEFRDRLADSGMRRLVGGPADLAAIEETDQGVYTAALEYNASVDALMRVSLTIRENGDGTFRTELP